MTRMKDDQPWLATLAATVRRERARRGWTLREMSYASGVSTSHISRVEFQRGQPSLRTAILIARAFDMTLGELVGV